MYVCIYIYIYRERDARIIRYCVYIIHIVAVNQPVAHEGVRIHE